MLFGIFLSAFFLGVKQDKKNILQLLSLAVVSGILYVLCVLLFGTETVDQIYPLIVHAPLLFVLVLHYKFRILPSLISIFTAYLCCQCSNWMGLFALFVTGQEWCYYVCRILVTIGVFVILCRYVCQTTAMLFAKTDRELLIIGSLPMVYYIFDYATTKFSSLLYTGNKAVPEFLGFAMCLTYLLFLLVYFREYEMKNKAEQYNELIRMQLNSFQTEMTNTRKSEKKMSILRHDTRHHLSVLRTLIQQGETDKALEYLISYFQSVDDPVEIVFFGDHQPSLNTNFYKGLNGKGLSGLTEDELENLYTVPFFIWTNYETETEEVPITSLNYLSTMALERAGIALPSYNQFLADMQQTIPAINSRGYYSVSSGCFKHLEEATGEEAEWIDRYQILQYNNMFDKKKQSKVFFPYLQE